MGSRSSVKVKANQAGGVAKARAAKDFKKPPGAKRGSRKFDSGYEAGDAGAFGKARKGALYSEMRVLFSGDERLDPGVEVVTERPELETKKAQVEKQMTAEERQNLRVLITRNGAVQIRDRQTGKITKNPVPAVRGKGGKFSDEVVRRIVVTDKDKFRAAQEERADNIQEGFLEPKGKSELRRAAILSAIEEDRKERGWEEVPTLD